LCTIFNKRRKVERIALDWLSPLHRAAAAAASLPLLLLQLLPMRPFSRLFFGRLRILFRGHFCSKKRFAHTSSALTM
jgi:hypothetical protein